MITASSQVVNMPRGKYKLADVLKHIVSERSGRPRRKGPAYREADRERQKKRRENPAYREAQREYHKKWYARKMMQEQNPDGLLELWSR
jgi:hypothetical protein